MHADRDAEHRGQGDEVSADVSVGDRSVIGAPIVHHAVNVLEGILLRVKAWGEPGCRPGRVGTLVENGVDLRIDVHNPALGDLENRSEPVHDVDSRHCCREISP